MSRENAAGKDLLKGIEAIQRTVQEAKSALAKVRAARRLHAPARYEHRECGAACPSSDSGEMALRRGAHFPLVSRLRVKQSAGATAVLPCTRRVEQAVIHLAA